jgi:predicted Fe-Mo cluster-binding NifX family protein
MHYTGLLVGQAQLLNGLILLSLFRAVPYGTCLAVSSVMERVGICHHVGRVSPVFDVASNLQIFDVDNGWVKQREEKVLVGRDPYSRAREVSGYGVSTVICGAVSQPLEQALHALGMKVIGFVFGSIDEIITAFVEGRLEDERFLMPGCCGQARRFGKQIPDGSFDDRANKGGPIKIAVTSTDGTMEGMVDERFGRCRKLVVYNPQSNAIEVLDNKANTGLAQGAGIQTAQNVVSAGAHAVISGDFGPKAFQVLRAAGIEVYSTANMTVREALSRFAKGKLTKLAGADVQSHW